MTRAALALAALALAAAAPSTAPALSPAEIVAADWSDIAAADLLVMTLAPDAAGHPRRVVIQLIPAPFSQGWVANIRTLATAHWYDGVAVTRVQDNYVAQWGDPAGDDKARAKPLPPGLRVVPASEYLARDTAVAATDPEVDTVVYETTGAIMVAINQRYESRLRIARLQIAGTVTPSVPEGWHRRDPYAPWVEVKRGWPIASDDGHYWPVHCYGTVGVGRDNPPDTGSGAELYAVIGQAPRHLDRNLAVVGRVVDGMEHLSSLPRGHGPIGTYAPNESPVPVLSVRLATDLPEAQRPHLQVLATDSESFARYVAARANRRDPFFIAPAGGVDICNLPVPIRPAPATPRP